MAPGRSVRVEIDEVDSGSTDAPEPEAPSPKQRSRSLLLGVCAVVVALVVALLAIRPSEGETAAGTQRQTPTTATVSPATSSVSTPTETVAPAIPAAFAGSDVVWGPSGFLALLPTGSIGSLPALYRSDDGLDWEHVEVEIPPIDETAIDFVDYSNLIAAGGQNFAILRTGFSNEGQGPRRAPRITERLVSADGQRWVLDGAVTTVQHQTLASPSFHVSNAFGFSIGAAVLQGTSGVGCEALLGSEVNPFANPQLIHRFGRVEPTEVRASSGVAHTQLSAARIASFTSNELSVDTLAACGVSPDNLDSVRLASIEIITPEDAVRQIPLPETVIDAGDLGDWPQPSLFGTDDGLLALLQRSVWHLDIDTEEWTWLLDLPAEADSIRDYQIVDGRYVVGLAEAVVIRADLELGEVATNTISTGLNPGSEILYADSEIIITESLDQNEATTRLDLLPSFFPEDEE